VRHQLWTALKVLIQQVLERQASIPEPALPLQRAGAAAAGFALCCKQMKLLESGGAAVTCNPIGTFVGRN